MVWTTTTPIARDFNEHPAGAGHETCHNSCITQYNAAALSVLKGKPQLIVNDLHAAVTSVCGTNFSLGECPIQNGDPPSSDHDGGGMHYNAAGRQLSNFTSSQEIYDRTFFSETDCLWVQRRS